MGAILTNQIYTSNGLILCIEKVLEGMLPAGIKWKLVKCRRELVNGGKRYNATRIGLCEKYGVINEDKQQYEFETEGNREKFDLALSVLLNEEFSIENAPVKIMIDKVEEKGGGIDCNALEILEQLGIVEVI